MNEAQRAQDNREQVEKADEIAVNLVEYLENEEIDCQLSPDAILAIRNRLRAAYAAGAANALQGLENEDELLDPDLETTLCDELIAELDGFDPWTHGKYPLAMETLADKLVMLRTAIRARQEQGKEKP